MKEHLQIIIVLTFLAAFTSCDEERPGISGESIITGVQNGKDWAAPADGVYNSSMDTTSMSGLMVAKNEVLGENLSFSNIPFRVGTYPLIKKGPESNKPSSVFYSVIGLDALNCRFDLDEASENFINVEIADHKSNYISGTFQAVYVRDPGDAKYDPYLPDTLRFTDGFFNVKIEPPR